MPTLNIWTLIPLFSCLSYIALCIAAIQSASKGTDNSARSIFVLYLAAAAFWSFTSFMLHLNAFPEQTIFWNELLPAALVATMITYYHFTQVYTGHRNGFMMYLGYFSLAVLTLLSLEGYIIKSSYMRNGALYHSLGNTIYFIGAFSLAYITAAMLLLIQKYRSTSDLIDRNRTVYLMVGWTILVGFTYTNIIPPLDTLPIDHLGSLANALLTAYVISRFSLLDIKFVVRRGLTYFLLTVVLIIIYTSAIFMGYRLLSAQPAVSIITLTTVIALMLAFTARPLRQAIQKGIDRLFYRDTYNARQILLSFRNEMGSILDLNELANEILPAITKALNITEARLILQDTVSSDFITQFTYPQNEQSQGNDLKFSVDNPIVVWLDKRNLPLSIEQIDVTPELKGLWQSEKEQLAQARLGFLYPIMSRGKLIGILALGKKLGKSSYSHEDIELVRSMAAQAGIIIENAQLYTQATLRANTDWLTGIYNHRNFHERLEEEIARCSRFGKVFSLIMIDIDLFKAYNDTYGHLAGDEVLRNIGKGITSSIRDVDLAFRYGGEEFSVILPETRLEDAAKVAERIRKTVEAKTSSLPLPITASLGIASWPLDGVMKEEIIARADAALYRSKQMGRNRTSLSSEVSRPETPLIALEMESKSKALSIVYALAATVDAKDHYTYGHSKKVSDYAVAIGDAMGLPQQKIATIRAAGLLHDIGKVGIPDSILNKKTSLTGEEWKLIKDHPKLGVEIIGHISDLSACLPAVMHHHERYDGTGYPSGLKGENIPIEARALAIADAYEAITSLRPYHDKPSIQRGISELRRCAGTQFDPEMVNIFCKLVEPSASKILEIK